MADFMAALVSVCLSTSHSPSLTRNCRLHLLPPEKERKVVTRQWTKSEVLFDDQGIHVCGCISSILSADSVSTCDYNESSHFYITENGIEFPKEANGDESEMHDAASSITCIRVRDGPTMFFIIFRYSKDDASAAALVKYLTLAVSFILDLRHFFIELKKAACASSILREQWKEDLKKMKMEQKGSRICSTLAFQKHWFANLDNSQKELLKNGFGSDDQSLLEEAVAYCPLTTFTYFKSITKLNTIPFDGYRVCRDIHALQYYYKKRITALMKEYNSQGLEFDENFQLFSITGGDCRRSKLNGQCEDATFCCVDEAAMGVFDGVGSWALEGIDASRFSSGLARECENILPDLVKNTGMYSNIGVNGRSRALLKLAHEKIQTNNPDAWGSSTAVVAVLDRYTGQLGISCLGDSGLMVLRRDLMPKDISKAYDRPAASSCHALLGIGRSIPKKVRKVVWRTTEQRWKNGAPYQLANLPKREDWRRLHEIGYSQFIETLHRVDPNGDAPDVAASPEHPIVCQPGDLILMFSDGVSDNLFDEEIECYCSFAISPEEAARIGNPSLATSPIAIAEAITSIAKRRSLDHVFQEAFVPLQSNHEDFTHQMHAVRGLDDSKKHTYRGGKKDDISCVACWVNGETYESIDLLINQKVAQLAKTSDNSSASQGEIIQTEVSTSASEASFESIIDKSRSPMQPLPNPSVSPDFPDLNLVIHALNASDMKNLVEQEETVDTNIVMKEASNDENVFATTTLDHFVQSDKSEKTFSGMRNHRLVSEIFNRTPQRHIDTSEEESQKLAPPQTPLFLKKTRSTFDKKYSVLDDVSTENISKKDFFKPICVNHESAGVHPSIQSKAISFTSTPVRENSRKRILPPSSNISSSALKAQLNQSTPKKSCKTLRCLEGNGTPVLCRRNVELQKSSIASPFNGDMTPRKTRKSAVSPRKLKTGRTSVAHDNVEPLLETCFTSALSDKLGSVRRSTRNQNAIFTSISCDGTIGPST